MLNIQTSPLLQAALHLNTEFMNTNLLYVGMQLPLRTQSKI